MPSKKLTEHDVKLMFQLYRDGMRRSEIAEKFDIGWHFCNNILRKERLKYWSVDL